MNNRLLAHFQALKLITALATGQRNEPKALLREVLRIVSMTLEVPLASIWVFDEEHQRLELLLMYDDRTHVYSEGGHPVLATEHPVYFQHLLKGELMVADDARRDVRTASFTAGYFEPYNIYSLLDAPIRIEGHLRGIICLEQTENYRGWAIDEQTFLLAVVEIVSLQIQLMQGERQPEQSLTREFFQALLEYSWDAIAVLDTEGKIIYVSPSFCRLMESGEGALLGLYYWDLIDPEFCEEAKKAWHTDPRYRQDQVLVERKAKMITPLGKTVYVDSKARGLFTNPAVKGMVVNLVDITRQ